MVPIKVELLATAALKPRPTNPRSHSPRQIQQIADSISLFGWTAPIIIDADNGILAGHGRYLAAKRLNVAEVPVIRRADLSPALAKAYVIADNQIALKSAWDDVQLRTEIVELMALDLDFSIDALGFEPPEIDLIIADPAAEDLEIATEPDDGPVVTQPGDIWILGAAGHRLLCGDATMPESYTALMAGEQAAAVFADPPYNVKIQGHAGGKGRIKHREFAMASGEMTDPAFATFLESVFENVASASRPGAIGFTCMDWAHADLMMMAAKRRFAELKNICVWDKGAAGMGSLYRSRHELVFVHKLKAGEHVNNIQLGRHGRDRSNVWTYGGVRARPKDLALHPTVKPISMVADAILDVTRQGDIVLDPFMGSGTTLLAAHRTRRRAFGLELDPAYVDLTVRRFIARTGETVVHAETGKRFEECAANTTPCEGERG